MAEEGKYDWVNEFEQLSKYLQKTFVTVLKYFCKEHPWMFQVLSSGIDKSLHNALKDLWDVHARLFSARECCKDLDRIVRVEKNPDDSWTYQPSSEERKKIIKERGLNSEQAKEFGELIFQKSRLLLECFVEVRKPMRALYKYGESYKAFWMKKNLNNFLQVMIAGMEKEVDKAVQTEKDTLNVESNDGSEFLRNGVPLSKDELFKKADEWGREKKALIRKVFREFEEDLRRVQRDVEEYWWEGETIEFLAKGAILLSATASVITIANDFEKDWVKWFVSIVGSGATGYLVYEIYMRIKNGW